MKKTVAVFEWITESMQGYQTVSDAGGRIPEHLVQVSEAVEVEFPELPKEVTVAAAVAAVGEQINELRIKHVAEINKLEERRNELLALTCDN